MKANNTFLQKILDDGVSSVIRVPKGTYWVDAEKPLRLRSNTHVYLTGVVLKAIPNASERYAILLGKNVKNVTVEDGELVGERHDHKGKGGEWGMGLRLQNAKNVKVIGTTARGCWGDGFYIGNCENIKMASVLATRNRRQGLSVVGVRGLEIKFSTFSFTSGTKPAAGIDFEPDNADQPIVDVLVDNCLMYGNRNGIECALKKAKSKCRNIVFRNCAYQGSGGKVIENDERCIKSDTFKWYEDLFYRILGAPKTIRIK